MFQIFCQVAYCIAGFCIQHGLRIPLGLYRDPELGKVFPLQYRIALYRKEYLRLLLGCRRSPKKKEWKSANYKKSKNPQRDSYSSCFFMYMLLVLANSFICHPYVSPTHHQTSIYVVEYNVIRHVSQ